MGTDTPIAALSATSRGCSSTTSASCSPRSPTRRWTRSARSWSPRSAGTIGPEANLLEPTPASCRQVVLPFPVIDNDDLAKIRHINRDGDMPGFITHVVARPLRRRGRRRGAGRAARRDLRRGVARRSPTAPASSCSPTGTPPPSWRRSRRCCSPARSTTTWSARRPAPRSACSSRPATSARCTTSRCSSATAPPRSTPTSRWSPSRTSPATATTSRSSPRRPSRNLVKALGKGVLKVMSKMGVSTVASYTGAQIFEAVGLSQAVVDRYFTGTTSKLGGIGLDTIAEEVARRHATAYPRGGIAPAHRELDDRRRVPVAPRGRAAPVRPRDGLPAPALHAHRQLRRLQAVHRAASTSSPSG